MESAGLVGNLASGLYPRNMDRKRIVGDESGEADALHDQLIKNMERSTFVMNTSRFLPEASLERIITRETIALVLPERLFGVSEEDIAIISEKMIKIFAVLIYIKIDAMSMIHLLNLLKDHHINDSNLPISQGEFFRFFRSLAHGENTNPPSLRRHVRSLHPEIEQFCEAQWIFIAPVLFNDGRECQFQRKHVLPFIEKEMPVYSKSDHRSYIYYKIHKDYLKDVSRRRLNYPLTVAVKDVTRGRTCYQHRPNEWKAEIKRLMAVEKLEQEHIVKFYAAIVQYKSTSPRFYLMFERADGGNLLDFWKAFPSTSGFATQTVQETFLQISGLVKALHAAHRGIQGVSMCHGNLKPAHILWIRGPGIGMFKLGGWEENRFQSPKSQYATPDSEALSPENDLWAFGCILLEMLIWMLYDAAELHRLKASIINGHDELELFDRDRLDFGKKRIEQRTPVIVAYYHAARHWISYMEGDPAFRLGQTAADDLFEIVKADLLVLDRTKTSVWTFLRKFRSSGWLARFKLDCGVDLYADLPRRYGSYIDKLASSLQGPGPKSPKSSASADPASQDTKGRSSTSKPALGTSVLIDTSSRNTQRPAKRPADRKRKHRKGESDDSDDQSDDTGEDEDKDNTSKRAADVQIIIPRDEDALRENKRVVVSI
ncbi:hypothetical protein N0V94_001255 [Neodidymelliopsis sp. IMI 364377]|nr:hypothetical protein N0V94_001255 [Neodidymelliopsis sp. IMI 364377]